MPKRKQDEDGHSPEHDSPLEKPKPKRKPKAKKEEAVPYPDEGWEIQPPSLIYRDFGVNPGKKIAAFDLDGTLTVVKSGRQFPKDSKDWRFFNKRVPEVVQKYHNEGYTVVIFSNQNGIKSKLDGKAAENVQGRIQLVVRELGVPAVALMATLKDDENRKPGRGMWDYFTAHLNGGVEPDLKSCFFVGDAAGRPGDIADSDRKFAEAIGIDFKIPEEVFGELEGKKAILPASALDSTDNLNEDLTELFQKLAEFFKDSNTFKARAFAKVALALRQFPSKIDASKYKEVSKLQGVGKGSLEVIKEWVETGKCAVLEEGTGEQLGEAQKAARAQLAATKSQAHAFL